MLFFFVKSAEKQKRVKFRLDFLIKKGKVGIWFIIYFMHNVYKSILLFPKTILFLAMLLVCRRCHLRIINEWMHWITIQISRLLTEIKSYNNIQSSRILFSCMCKKPWGTTTTTKKLEINLRDLLCPFLSSSRSQMTQMPMCYSKFVCVSLEQHCSWPSGIDRDHLIIFRILDSECYHSQSLCLEFGFWFYCSCGFLFCANTLVNPVPYTLRMTEFKALCLIMHCRPLLRFSLLRTVPTIVIAHTFCASPDTRISYRQCLPIQG